MKIINVQLIFYMSQYQIKLENYYKNLKAPNLIKNLSLLMRCKN